MAVREGPTGVVGLAMLLGLPGCIQPSAPSPPAPSPSCDEEKAQPPGPRLRRLAITVSGRLAPEHIQRTACERWSKIRACYETGLRKNPNLLGRVGVRFVIDGDGAISHVSDGGSDLPDPWVVDCVV